MLVIDKVDYIIDKNKVSFSMLIDNIYSIVQ